MRSMSIDAQVVSNHRDDSRIEDHRMPIRTSFVPILVVLPSLCRRYNVALRFDCTTTQQSLPVSLPRLDSEGGRHQ